jgi:uncharacterized protein DUF1707
MAKETLVSLRDSRERAIAVLSDLFAKDDLELDEFERRVSLVHRAASVADVEAVLGDLPAPEGEVKLVPATALAPVAAVREKQTLAAVLGGVERRGTWTSARHLKLITILGGAVLDFREARLAPGLTEVYIFALMGGAQIIVPPGLAVETGGIAILGGFEHMERTPIEPDPDRPTLRVHGFCLMGGVSIETRLAGESERDANKRRRRERRDQRRLEAGRR